ncbi:MAG: sterol desaturase family protein, partial [Myxococcales bacterium]|nr:sterol desaturase family protein [Myxococcales bacterium]
ISGTLVVGGLSAAGYALVGLPGVSFAFGFGVVYATYEVIHRRLHTAAPLNAYGRWARRHHFYHHFADARRNHGVTTPLWDHVFRTFSRAETLRVPPRLAMDWLLDDAGAIRPQFAAEYHLGGRR